MRPMVQEISPENMDPEIINDIWSDHQLIQSKRESDLGGLSYPPGMKHSNWNPPLNRELSGKMICNRAFLANHDRVLGYILMNTYPYKS